MFCNEPSCSISAERPDILPLAQGFGIIPSRWCLHEILFGMRAFIEKYPVLNQRFSPISPNEVQMFLYAFQHLLDGSDVEITQSQFKSLTDLISRIAEIRLRHFHSFLLSESGNPEKYGVNPSDIAKLLEPSKLEELKNPEKRVRLLATGVIGPKIRFYYQGTGPFLFVDLRRSPFEVKHRVYLNPSRDGFPEVVRALLNGCRRRELDIYFKFADYTKPYYEQRVIPYLDLVRGDKIVVYCGDNLVEFLEVLRDVYVANQQAFIGRQTLPFTGKIVCARNKNCDLVLEGVGYGEEIRSKPGVPYAESFTVRRAQFLSQALRCIALKSTKQLPRWFRNKSCEEVNDLTLNAVFEKISNKPGYELSEENGPLGEVFGVLVTHRPDLLIDLEPHELAEIARKHDIDPNNLCRNFPD